MSEGRKWGGREGGEWVVCDTPGLPGCSLAAGGRSSTSSHPQTVVGECVCVCVCSLSLRVR